MRIVVIGGVLLMVGASLLAVAPGSAPWFVAVFIGVFETLFGTGYWWWTRRRGHWPLRGSEQAVVLAAVGMLIGVLLTSLGGALGIAGLLLWWIFALVFVLTALAYWRAVRRRSATAAAAEPELPAVEA